MELGSNGTFLFYPMLRHANQILCKTIASAGNRTRASRVAGENSTTEPPMHGFRLRN